MVHRVQGLWLQGLGPGAGLDLGFGRVCSIICVSPVTLAEFEYATHGPRSYLVTLRVAGIERGIHSVVVEIRRRLKALMLLLMAMIIISIIIIMIAIMMMVMMMVMMMMMMMTMVH